MTPFDVGCSSLGLEFLCFDFMRSALIAAACVGIAAPSIGIYLVQRRLSLMGDGIGHVAFTGVAAGLLAGVLPVLTALVAAVVGAVVIELLRERGRTAGDVALAIVFYGGIAGGILLVSLSGSAGVGLLPYLFGSVITVGPWDLALVAGAGVAVVAITASLRKELFAVTFDEEVARVAGFSVRAYNLLVAVTAAVTVAVTMKVVGILLVSAMLVLPVAAAQQVTSSFRATVWLASLIGAAVSVGGLILAFYVDVAPGATIVLSAIGVFGLLRVLSGLHVSPLARAKEAR
ncbi:MAG: metal ABC transporter permease [Actinomycetota bacterium]